MLAAPPRCRCVPRRDFTFTPASATRLSRPPPPGGANHWSNTGQTLVKLWSNAGQMIAGRPASAAPSGRAAAVSYTGQIPVEYWSNALSAGARADGHPPLDALGCTTPQTLVKYWSNTGQTPVKPRSNTGQMPFECFGIAEDSRLSVGSCLSIGRLRGRLIRLLTFFAH
jgi:hypothetical protein